MTLSADKTKIKKDFFEATLPFIFILAFESKYQIMRSKKTRLSLICSWDNSGRVPRSSFRRANQTDFLYFCIWRNKAQRSIKSSSALRFIYLKKSHHKAEEEMKSFCKMWKRPRALDSCPLTSGLAEKISISFISWLESLSHSRPLQSFRANWPFDKSLSANFLPGPKPTPLNFETAWRSTYSNAVDLTPGEDIAQTRFFQSMV